MFAQFRDLCEMISTLCDRESNLLNKFGEPTLKVANDGQITCPNLQIADCRDDAL